MQRPCASRSPASAALAALLAAALLAAACTSTAERLPSPAQEAAAARSQGAARAFKRGDLQQALKLYTEALAAAESVEDFEAGGTALLNLALVHARLGQYPAAHARVDRVLAAPQRYGAALHAQAAARKALLYLDAPDLDAALRLADAAEKACAEPCPLAAVLINVRAYVALERGDAERAATLAARAVELASAAHLEAEQANALRLSGRAHTRGGRTAQAAQALAQALELDRQLGLSDRVALDLVYAAENEQRRDQPEAAREYYERAMTVYRAAGNLEAAQAMRLRMGSVERR